MNEIAGFSVIIFNSFNSLRYKITFFSGILKRHAISFFDKEMFPFCSHSDAKSNKKMKNLNNFGCIFNTFMSSIISV